MRKNNIEMKKVGIITILKVNNYGAELQAFALHRKLQTLGVENEVIDYLYYKHPDYQFENFRSLFDHFTNKYMTLRLMQSTSRASSTSRRIRLKG